MSVEEILNHKDLYQLDSFLSILIGEKAPPQTEYLVETKCESPIYWLEQLAQIGGISSIENPVEWQRTIREDRKLPFR